MVWGVFMMELGLDNVLFGYTESVVIRVEGLD